MNISLGALPRGAGEPGYPDTAEAIEATTPQIAADSTSIKSDIWPVLIALATGARRGRNIDLVRGTVRIVESLEQTTVGLRFKSPNTNRARVVTLPAFAVDGLRRLKREQAERLLLLAGSVRPAQRSYALVPMASRYSRKA